MGWDGMGWGGGLGWSGMVWGEVDTGGGEWGIRVIPNDLYRQLAIYV